MSLQRGSGVPDRGMAAGLVRALKGALASHDPEAPIWRNAADIAELLRLDGLAALLAACRPHAATRSADVVSALDRLARLTATTERDLELAALLEVDRELAALAGMIAAQEWGVPAGSRTSSVALQSLADLLADLRVDDAEALARCIVTLQVGAAVRAAIDWLDADGGSALRLKVQDAVATFTLRVAHPDGLAPAGAVLGLAGASLLPDGEGHWLMRVPLHADRPAWLLARQGALSIAIPWSAVARLRIAGESGRETLAEPSLAPWSPLVRARGERPAALLAQGLSCAWLHLDHIVWRVFAAPEAGHAPAELPGTHQVIRTEQQEMFAVLDPEAALRAIAPVATAVRWPRPRATPPAPPAPPVSTAGSAPTSTPPSPPVLSVVPAPVSAARPVVAPHAAEAPALVVLGPERVQPITQAATPVMEVAPSAPRAPHALVVEDSIAHRLTVARALEQAGWIVETVDRARAMEAALAATTFDAVFLDLTLPDARGREPLAALLARSRDARRGFAVIALVRDIFEDRLARELGAAHVVSKPFAAGALEAVVRSLGTTSR